MSLFRRILFIIFAAVYLVVAPLTVLYALGYIFNPHQQTLMQTGLISLSSDPPHAEVWLNGEKIKDETPVVLWGLKPGTYHLRIALPGRQDWERSVQVKPDRALRFEKILLFSRNFAPEILGGFTVEKMWHPFHGRYLFILQREAPFRLYVYDLEEKEFRVVPLKSYDPETKIRNVYFHPLGDQALVVLERKDALIYQLIKLGDLLRVIDVTGLFPEPFTSPKWSLNHKGSLFYLKNGILKRIDLEQKLLYPDLAKEIQGYVLRGGNIYILDQKKRFLELSEKGKLREILFDDPQKVRLIFGSSEKSSYSIFLLNHSIALFLSEEGRFLTNRLPYFLDEEVHSLTLATSYPRVAYPKGDELWVIDFEKEPKESFFESGPTPRLIDKANDSLKNILWFYDDQYLLYLRGNQLAVQDFEGDRSPTLLFEVSKKSPEVILDEKRGYVYYAEPREARLARVKLYEESELVRLVDGLVAAGSRNE